MVLTNDEELYKKVRAISDHGHKYLPDKPRGEDEALCLGFNFKMNELQGAIGIAQLQKLDYIIERQRKNKEKIIAGIRDIPNIKLRSIVNPEGDIGDSVTFFLRDFEKANEFIKKWKERGQITKNIPDAMNWHFAGLWNHLDLALPIDDLESSYDLLSRAVSIPVYVNMDDRKITEVITNIMDITKDL